MNTPVVILVVLASTFVCLDALSCHSCTYVKDLGGETCNDPYTGNNTEECSTGEICQKSTISLDGTVTTVARSCSSSCSTDCISFFSLETCTYCCSDKDHCNGAGAVTFGLTIMAASVLTAIVASSF